MAKPKPAEEAEDDLSLTYNFNSDGALVSVGYAGALTPEIHEKIKAATLEAREIGKGRS